MNEKISIFACLCLLFVLSGCFEGMVRDPDGLSTLVDTIHALSTANVASAPVNPLAVPIGIGLSGLIGVLEALRRKEKSGRKHAEQELNGNNKS